MPVILATQKSEIRRTEVQSQPWQTVHETLAGGTKTKQKQKHQKRADGMDQGGSQVQNPVPKTPKKQRLIQG
jgi:hypothetical protein